MSDPDIYITNEGPDVSMTNYIWRSANIGADRIDIQPTDPQFTYKGDDEEGGDPAYYFIGVMPYREGVNTMMVSLTLIEASKTLQA